jgi:ketosteroid isomerase-like protein
MKRIAYAVCVAVFLFAVAAQAQTPALTEVEQHATQELITLEKGWSEAYLKKDIAFLDRILADDYVETNSEGNVTTKAEALADLKSGAYVPISGVQDNVKVRVYGDAAVATGRSTVKAQYKGKDASGQFQWTDTWVKLAGRWQCVAEHYSKIPQK